MIIKISDAEGGISVPREMQRGRFLKSRLITIKKDVEEIGISYSMCRFVGVTANITDCRSVAMGSIPYEPRNMT